MARVHRRIALAACLVVLGPLAAAAAPPKLDYLFPPGAGRGQSVKVTAEGTFSHWPVEVWTDREGLTVDCEKTKGALSVTVDVDAGAGIYWLRLYDREGATALRPIFVDTLPELLETEPNDDPQTPQRLSSSSIINGRLARRGDVDCFAIDLQHGQTLVASLQAREILGSPMDGVLQICTADGFVLEQNDDARGLDPLLVFQAPGDGMYLVRTFAFPATPNSTIALASGDNFVYRLTVTTGGFLDHAFPMSLHRLTTTPIQLFGWNLSDPMSELSIEPAEGVAHRTVFRRDVAGALVLPVLALPHVVADEASSPDAPQTLKLPVVVTGRIDATRDVDTFCFQAKKGEKLSFRVEARSLGFPLDAVLQLADSSGKLLAEVDDVSRQPDCAITHTVAADGEYRLSIRDLHHLGGFRYVYRLTAEPLTPDFSLVMKTDTFVLTPGKPLEIAIDVTRENGFADELEVTAEELPDGVTVEPAKSTASGESAKSVKLKLTAATGPMHGPFRIVGHISGQAQSTKTARFGIADRSTNHSDLWLTVLATPSKS